MDKIPWYQKYGILQWLWVLCHKKATLFKIHTNRNAEAFYASIEKWAGILVSDNYTVYCKWINLRQTCLAHLIRSAKKLSTNPEPEIAKFGTWAQKELKLLVSMAHAPPTNGQWCAFYARLCRLIALNKDRKDQAGRRTPGRWRNSSAIFGFSLKLLVWMPLIIWRKECFVPQSSGGA
ncbi:hypothetical protein DO021_10765 [Desulfobacter hydrogenophilus]|uniref:Transposase IS66 central domain-containing protein n=1 Tax=Desulfobacter hydrogenophilus TaxID=2291 RepID=A0A328FCA0_9BACT|nr:transposase [Desulfobacter hydrogenophilus]NDY71995.1 transposase [Desulfobacter hydrogenophilus]QBH15444.1 hypothetical protein EYB58_22610 [Desulfobacter hydrogenophilus]RAM01919.1 hypothetical protein DO021_10765 [Desulfobacter hydrogenophilus]